MGHVHRGHLHVWSSRLQPISDAAIKEIGCTSGLKLSLFCNKIMLSIPRTFTKKRLW